MTIDASAAICFCSAPPWRTAHFWYDGGAGRSRHPVVGSGTPANVPAVRPLCGCRVVIARRRPGNPIGWLMIGIALFGLLQTDAGSTPLSYYHLGHWFGGSPSPPPSGVFRSSSCCHCRFCSFPTAGCRRGSGAGRWWCTSLLPRPLSSPLAAPAAAPPHRPGDTPGRSQRPLRYGISLRTPASTRLIQN